MEHAASPSLISLGLSTDTNSEESSFRWGLVLSCALHALIIILSMFIRIELIAPPKDSDNRSDAVSVGNGARVSSTGGADG